MRGKSRATSCCLCRCLCLCLCQTQIWCDRHPLIRGSEIVCQINNQIKSPSSSPFSSPSPFHHHHHIALLTRFLRIYSRLNFPEKPLFGSWRGKWRSRKVLGRCCGGEIAQLIRARGFPRPLTNTLTPGPTFEKGSAMHRRMHDSRSNYQTGRT